MTTRSYVKTTLLLGLIALSAAGFLLHLRIHPASQNPSNLVPVVSGILGILIIPILFSFKKTIAYAYVINGMEAIVGTVTMTHFSLAHWPSQTTLGSILLMTLLGDILVLWGKFGLGMALFNLELFGYDPEKQRKGAYFRYPNLGWWLVHLVGISVVYSLGHHFWR